MNTLSDHEDEFRKGLISEGGIRALADAEVYGNVSSIGAMEASLRIIHKALIDNGMVEVNHPINGKSFLRNESDLQEWCSTLLPSARWENVQSL